MNKRQARLMALELAAGDLQAGTNMGVAWANTDNYIDAEKVQTELNKIIEQLEAKAQKLRGKQALGGAEGE